MKIQFEYTIQKEEKAFFAVEAAELCLAAGCRRRRQPSVGLDFNQLVRDLVYFVVLTRAIHAWESPWQFVH